MPLKLTSIIYFGFVIFLLSCNKNTNELPPITIKPAILSLPVWVNGLNIVDFIFEKTTTETGDTVWLSIKNNTAENIESMTYLVELCKALPQNYDNCDLELTAQIPNTLKAYSTLKHIISWTNKNILLDSALINGGIISYSGNSAVPLSNIYSSIYSEFETDTSANASLYYGVVRGYVLADGKAIFRIKGNDQTNYNAIGQFTQLKAFDGLLTKDNNNFIAPFNLDTFLINGKKILADTSSGKLAFRLHLHLPLNDTINSILVLTKKYY